MSLSNIPDYILIREGNKTSMFGSFDFNMLIDHELNLRQPNEITYHFGDCDGLSIFIPVEPEYDSEGQPIVSEMMGYGDGNEIWTDTN